MNSGMRWFLIGALAMLALSLVVGLGVVMTGSYNVAATDRHSALGGWALNTNFVNSVRRQARGLEAPVRFTPAMIAAGAGEYKAMCQQCHGGAGAEREEWAEGMRPKPPALAEAAGRWDAAEVFWLVKHGAKMTGMPAFGETHDDATLWNIAGFVKALPTMSASRYAAYEAEEDVAGHHHEAGEETAADHAHPPGTPPHED